MDSFSPAPLKTSGAFLGHSGVPAPALRLKHCAKLDIVNDHIKTVTLYASKPPADFVIDKGLAGII